MAIQPTFFQAAIPRIVDTYKTHVAYMFDNMVKVHGLNLKGVVNSFEFARQYMVVVKPCVSYSSTGIGVFDKEYFIDEDKLNRIAYEYAEMAISAWEAKLNKKIGDLNSIELLWNSIDCSSFTVRGIRDESIVKIEQQMIINVSSKGMMFNQFPARIYVNGKSTSEAKYKKLFSILK
jgi:hypothetical protein